MTAALSLRDLAVEVAGRRVVDGVSLEVAPGSVVGLIGPNGAGKTTLLDAVTGFVPSTGAVLLDGSPLTGSPHDRARRGVVRTFQGLELFEDLDVAENLRVAAESGHRAEEAPVSADVLGRLGLARVAGRLPRELPHGHRVLVALGRALAGRPAVLLLDEPAAGLDADERAELARVVRELAEAGTAVVLVDHDTDLVLQTCDIVHVLQGGRLLASGRPAQVRNDPRVVAAYLGSGDHPARTAAAAVGGGATDAVVVDGLRARYGDVAVLHDVGLRVVAGEVVAVLGRNGAGKTTLLRALAGLHRPTAGRVEVLGAPPRSATRAARRGVTLVPQGRGLFLRLTARENLRLTRARLPQEQVLDRFPDLAGALDRPAAALSGGQQQQLALARALLAAPHLLLVDELSLGLAPHAVDQLLALLRDVADGGGTTVVLVEQHPTLALTVADRAYVLDRGRVVLSGSSAELAADPDRLRAAYLGDA